MKQTWPKELYLSASEKTGKIYGHLNSAKNRQVYIHPSQIMELQLVLRIVEKALKTVKSHIEIDGDMKYGPDIEAVKVASKALEAIQETK